MDSDSDGPYDDYPSDGSEYDEHGEEEDQAEYDEYQVEVEEEEGETDEGGTTDQEEMTDGREVTDAGETGDEWDTDSERSTDEEEEETEDEEIIDGPFNIPDLYDIPCFVSFRSLQHGSTPATQASAEAEPTTKETWDIIKSILEDKTTYKALLQTTGDKAQALLDAMQKLLDDQSTPSDLRNRILRAVAHLCARSSLYPQCLVLREIQYEKEREAFGSFGDIWIGSYKEHRVCLKAARIYRRQDVNKLFKSYAKEAILWSQFFHPNLLPFYGIYYIQGEQGGTPSRIGLVSPWMQNGNIGDYMHINPEIPRRPLVDDILAGLMYLHKLNIVHADIKGANILISPNGSACVADFGLSSIVDAGTLDWTPVQTTHTAAGTIRWTAPELLDDAESDGAPRPTFAGDVYAMASTMYEILADKIPFYEFRSNVTVMWKVIQGVRPTKPPEEPELELSNEVWEVMWNCWSKMPSERPTMDEIAEKLNNIPYNEVTTRRMAQHQMNQDNHEILSFTSQSFRDAIRGGESNISAAELDLLKEFSSSGSVKASLTGQVAGEVTVVNQS